MNSINGQSCGYVKTKYFSAQWKMCVCFLFLTMNLWSQQKGDFIESAPRLDSSVGERVLQYHPEGEDIVCLNGKNRFSRALYGTNTAFRVETSDMPEFGLFMPNMGGNIQLGIIAGKKCLWLNKAERIKTRYRAGARIYEISDPLFGKGSLVVTALAMAKSEGIILKVEGQKLPADMELLVMFGGASNKRFSRNGDLGVDDPKAFDLTSEACLGNSYSISKNSFSLVYGSGTKGGPCKLDGVFPSNAVLKLSSLTRIDSPLDVWNAAEAKDRPVVLAKCKLLSTIYFAIKNPDKEVLSDDRLVGLFAEAEAKRKTISNALKIDTPDPFFNTLGGVLAAAADGIWDEKTFWQHGAIGWRMPLNGWRAAYVGDAIGWHDRARQHFNGYAASQITNVKPIYPHPTQDSTLHLARAEKRWGTQMYSNGYITRNPNDTTKMHHYDMNLVYIDELLWHFNWTGDLDYVRKMWPVLKRHLAWEKRNFDPDDDGLYDAYACIWASDALQYNSGGVTHSSAYNYRSNKMAAEIARKIGEDPSPYEKEAEKILAAINKNLWMPEKGWWAEYKDLMGNQLLHPDAALWTVYHAIDSDIEDPFQAYQATRYVDTEIPHIDVTGKGLEDDRYQTLSTTNWLPYSWSINNVAFAEVGHASLAYWEAGRKEEAFKLFKSNILDGMYLGVSQGNIGQISFYDAARGECYRDFGDPIGVYSRAIVQGLFGILPDAMNNSLLIRPGFPSDWDHASIETSDIQFHFSRKALKDTYQIESHFSKPLALTLLLDAPYDKVASVKVNGLPVKWELVEGISKPQVKIGAYKYDRCVVEVVWGGERINKVFADKIANLGQDVKYESNVDIVKIYDPQTVFKNLKESTRGIQAQVVGQAGHRTAFVELKKGEMTWFEPLDILVKDSAVDKMLEETKLTIFPDAKYDVVVMDSSFNESVSRIFKNSYLAPRSPYTTLEVPTQGIGEWCHPLLTANIDDSGLRNGTKNNIFQTSIGIPFRTVSDSIKPNIAFTSLWNNFPDSLSIPLSGKASYAYFLLAGTTNHMQCHVVNGIVEVVYSDGTSAQLALINPETWAPIEQDFYVDGKAFCLTEPKPYRLAFKSGIVSRNLGVELGIKPSEVYGRHIDGGAGIILGLPLNREKELKSVKLKTIANEVIVGLMGVTLCR